VEDVIYRRGNSGSGDAKEENRARVPCESSKKRVMRTTGARSKPYTSVRGEKGKNDNIIYI